MTSPQHLIGQVAKNPRVLLKGFANHQAHTKAAVSEIGSRVGNTAEAEELASRKRGEGLQ